MSQMGAVARRYAEELGFHVFPVADDCKPGRLSWVNGAPEPKFLAVYDATNDPKVIDDYWRVYPNANISMATGLLSGVFVLDIDTHAGAADGFQTLDRMEMDHGMLPDTAFVDTPSGGRHLYFKNPDRPLRNRVNFVPGIDVRATGGAVPLPPSHKPNGEYQTAGLSGFAEAPDWLLELIDPPQPIIARVPFRMDSSERASRYVMSALTSEAGRVRNTPPNTGRNQQLFKSAASLGGLCAAGLVSDDYVVSILSEAASYCGLVRDDGIRSVIATIQSGLRASRDKPREVDLGRR